MKRFYCWNSDSIDLYGTAQDSIADSVLDSIFEAFSLGMDCFCDGEFFYKMYSFPCGHMWGIKVIRLSLKYADKPSIWMYESFWRSIFCGYYIRVDEMEGINYVP